MQVKAITRWALASTLSLVLLPGCGSIQHYETLAQPMGKDLETYVGGTIFKIDRTSDLPNAFGKADLYGGKVFNGYTEVHYQGLSDDAKILVRITEVATHSTETAMSRYGTSHGTYTANNYGGGGSGTVTIHDPPKGSTDVLPPNTAQVAVDSTKDPEMTIAGVRIHFIEGTTQKLRYRLEKGSTQQVSMQTGSVTTPTTKYSEYRGNVSVDRGTGGTVRKVDGIDIWETGDPDCNFRVLGVINQECAENHGKSISTPAVIKEAKAHGADAVVLLKSELNSGTYQHVLAAVKYLKTETDLRQNLAGSDMDKSVEKSLYGRWVSDEVPGKSGKCRFEMTFSQGKTLVTKIVPCDKGPEMTENSTYFVRGDKLCIDDKKTQIDVMPYTLSQNEFMLTVPWAANPLRFVKSQ
jgi:hypothetical protein